MLFRSSSSSTVPNVSEATIWTNYQGTTVVAGVVTAGAGNGTYTLQVSAPCKGILTQNLLGYDIAGNARSGNQAAGCYA